jgi:hypothetical protein
MSVPIIVDDNFVRNDFKSELESMMTNGTIPWFYVPNTVPPEREYRGFDSIGFFTHMYLLNGEKNSEFLAIILSLFESFINKHNIDVKGILHCRSNFMLRSDTKKTTFPHIDFDSPHKVFLYYVNDCDGDTVFFKESGEDLSEIDRISPKSGRAVLFDGLTLHGIQPPVLSDYRIVVNIPFV